ncbi:hypothetical protein PISMIDRAFT_409181 [Pisolithus microcarpus 441]|uniref:Uncharacterized protein n=1 Tax=Pisolithus microcarpus 441 TaxID=765257 RepID=A0A0C9Z5M4_9AGAM|nr:hypothetical protein PISMIDRAFT_409181 [Pisolithus microcarpus 441]
MGTCRRTCGRAWVGRVYRPNSETILFKWTTCIAPNLEGISLHSPPDMMESPIKTANQLIACGQHCFSCLVAKVIGNRERITSNLLLFEYQLVSSLTCLTHAYVAGRGNTLPRSVSGEVVH